MTDNIKYLLERLRRQGRSKMLSAPIEAADLIEQLDDRIAEVTTHCRVKEAALESKNEALKGAAVIAEAAGAEIRALKERIAALEADASQPRYDFTVRGMKQSPTGNWVMAGDAVKGEKG